jgi:hypothetical protein
MSTANAYEPVPSHQQAALFVRRGPVRALRNYAGQRFERLAVGRFLGVLRNAKGNVGQTVWEVTCDCGVVRAMRSGSFKRSVSCGCFHRELARAMRLKHGACESPEYGSWKAMIARCTNPKNSMYYLYGGRGIKVYAKWRESFEAIRADVGPRPPGMTLEPIKSEQWYEPGNCRWATPAQQMRNLRTNRNITFRGETMTIADWAKRTGLRFLCLWLRLDRGWTIERALTTPLVHKRKTTRAA